MPLSTGFNALAKAIGFDADLRANRRASDMEMYKFTMESARLASTARANNQTSRRNVQDTQSTKRLQDQQAHRQAMQLLDNDKMKLVVEAAKQKEARDTNTTGGMSRETGKSQVWNADTQQQGSNAQSGTRVLGLGEQETPVERTPYKSKPHEPKPVSPEQQARIDAGNKQDANMKAYTDNIAELTKPIAPTSSSQ